jgi:hypothetical protein
MIRGVITVFRLPLISRSLRAHNGRRIRRSPHPRAAISLGSAIAAAGMAGYAGPQRSPFAFLFIHNATQVSSYYFIDDLW